MAPGVEATQSGKETAPAWAQDERRFKVFLSYSRGDSAAFAAGLVKALEAQGLAAKLDTRDLEFGEKWQAQLKDFIRQADAVVYVVSPRSIASKWCRWELAQVAAQSKRLVPVVHVAVKPEELPAEIGEVQLFQARPGIDFRPDDAADLAALAGRLAEGLQKDRAWLQEHTRLTDLAYTWAQEGKSRDHLLRGGALSSAETWMARRPANAPAPSRAHLDFISASQVAAKQRGRMWVGGLAAVAVGATGLAGWAELERRRKDKVLTASTKAANELVFDVSKPFQQQIGVPSELITSLLTRAQVLLEELARESSSRVDVQSSRGAALIELSAAFRGHGDTAAALRTASAAVSLFDRLATEGYPSDVDIQWRRQAAYDRLGEAQRLSGDGARASESFTMALRLAKELVDLVPDRTEFQRNLAVSHEKMGDLEADGATSLLHFEESLVIRRRMAETAGTIEARRDLSIILEKIGTHYLKADDIAVAQTWLDESLGLSRRLAKEHERRSDLKRDLAASCQRLGTYWQKKGQLQRALELFQEDLALTRELAKSDANRIEWQRDLAVSLEKAGKALRKMGDPGAAAVHFAESRDVLTRVASRGALSDHLLLASTYKTSSDLMIELGKPSDGLQLALGRIDFTRGQAAAAPELSPVLADALGNAAWYALFAREFDTARKLAEEALTLQPGALWIELNRAHAVLLCCGEADALALYRQHRGQDIPRQGPWSKVVADDFATLRKAGVEHPSMDRVIADLAM